MTKNTLETGDVFTHCLEAANEIGCEYKGLQKCVKHPFFANTLVWFPKLNDEKKWINRVTKNGSYIWESPVDKSKTASHVNKYVNGTEKTRVTFGSQISPAGTKYYIFMGVYRLVEKRSNDLNGLCWKRVSKTTPKSIQV